jgi:hypothetical protein
VGADWADLRPCDLHSFMPASSADQGLALQVDVKRGRHKLIVLYLVSAPVATIAWVVGPTRAAIWLVEFVLSHAKELTQRQLVAQELRRGVLWGGCATRRA